MEPFAPPHGFHISAGAADPDSDALPHSDPTTVNHSATTASSTATNTDHGVPKAKSDFSPMPPQPKWKGIRYGDKKEANKMEDNKKEANKEANNMEANSDFSSVPSQPKWRGIPYGGVQYKSRGVGRIYPPTHCKNPRHHHRCVGAHPSCDPGACSMVGGPDTGP